MKKALLAVCLLFFASKVEAQSFRILESKVRQGGVAVIKIAPEWLASNMPDPAISFLGENYPPSMKGYVFIGIDVHLAPGKYYLALVEHESGSELNSDWAEMEVLRVNFPKTRTASFTGSPTGKRNPKEANPINRAFSSENRLRADMTQGLNFVPPVSGNLNVIDSFGLIYRNNPALIHGGIDIKLPVGTPVKAVNSGMIVLVAKRFRREGNMVIINHGAGIFSVYMHLSKINVTEGVLVKQGQVFALSGRTGRGVREPHLHWNMRVQKTYVDPLKFIETMNKVVASGGEK